MNVSLASVAGCVARKGFLVEAVLTREDLAWDGLEDRVPTSISDMIVEVTEHPHGGNKKIEKALEILGLVSVVELLDVVDHSANTVQNQHAAFVHGLHGFLDVHFIGYDAHMYITQFRTGAKTVIMMCKKSEADALSHATPRYKKWLDTRGSGWAPEQLNEGFEHEAEDED